MIDLNEARKGKGGKRRAPPVAAQGDKTLDERVAEINEEFALVIVGGDTLVLNETVDVEGRPETRFLSVQAFRTWLGNCRFWDKETDKTSGLGDLWIKHPGRRSFKGIDFAPDGAPPGWYNIWRGFAVTPAEPERDRRRHEAHFPTLLDHVVTNVAGGSIEHARWIWGWFAHLVQRPTERIGTSLVMRGRQGVGKSKLGETIGKLLGRHWIMIDQPKHLTGQFNAHMLGCLLLQAEEAFWAGDKQAEGTLKSLVTSGYHLIERKNIDAVPVRNLVRLMITSNNDWAVPAGFEERRFAVFDVGDACRQNFEYFAQIDREIAAGGAEHLLAWLMSFDLHSVDVRQIPSTGALMDQKLGSMSPFQSWWLDVLMDGKFDERHIEWRTTIAVDSVYRSYLTHVERVTRGRKLFKAEFGKQLARMMPDGFQTGQKISVTVTDEQGVPYRDGEGNDKQKRVNAYHVPDLGACRSKFYELIGHDIIWPPDEGTVLDSG